MVDSGYGLVGSLLAHRPAERSKVPKGQKVNLFLSRTANSLNQTNGRYGFPIPWGLLGDD